jgi:hypothetical protein
MKHMLRICQSKEERCFIKWPAPRQRARGWRGPFQDRGHGGADSRATGHQNYNQAPAYIRGSGPLD